MSSSSKPWRWRTTTCRTGRQKQAKATRRTRPTSLVTVVVVVEVLDEVDVAVAVTGVAVVAAMRVEGKAASVVQAAVKARVRRRTAMDASIAMNVVIKCGTARIWVSAHHLTTKVEAFRSAASPAGAATMLRPAARVVMQMKVMIAPVIMSRLRQSRHSVYSLGSMPTLRFSNSLPQVDGYTTALYKCHCIRIQRAIQRHASAMSVSVQSTRSGKWPGEPLLRVNDALRDKEKGKADPEKRDKGLPKYRDAAWQLTRY